MLNTFFLTLFFTLFAVAFLYFLDFFFFVFWRVPWLDSVAHFGGGFWAGGIVLWSYVYVFNPPFQKNSRIFFVLCTVVAAFTIGILWEIYEVLIYPTLSSTEGYFFDTMTDLIADTAGAFVAGLHFLFTCREIKTHE